MKLALTAALVVAHFTATSLSATSSRTCGAVTATSATYSGAGMTIVARSTVDARRGMGLVQGTLKSASMTAQFSAVDDHGALSGIASGHVGARLFVARLSATFSAAGGFTDGVVGGAGTIGGAVVLEPGCTPPPLRQLRHAAGLIKAATAAQITVGHLTCKVPTSLAITVATTYPPGRTAAITCVVSDGETTLVTIRATR